MNVLRGTFFIFPDEMKYGPGENKKPTPSFSQWQNRHLERLFAQHARSGKQVRSKMHGIFAGGVKGGFPYGGQGGETGGIHIQNIAVFQLYLSPGLFSWFGVYPMLSMASQGICLRVIPLPHAMKTDVTVRKCGLPRMTGSHRQIRTAASGRTHQPAPKMPHARAHPRVP